MRACPEGKPLQRRSPIGVRATVPRVNLLLFGSKLRLQVGEPVGCRLKGLLWVQQNLARAQ
eukprot:1376960-Rhodomonas_salina.1